MARIIDLTNQRYERLLVLRLADNDRYHGQASWLCRCDCGQEITVPGARLRSGAVISCGCHRPGRNIPLHKYSQHKGNAKLRGVPFLLTFEEWWSIWQESGNWEQRGARRGQYVMARYGDTGPYAVGNVRICLARENYDEVESTGRMRNYGERNGAFGKDFWATATPEQQEARRQAITENSKAVQKASNSAPP